MTWLIHRYSEVYTNSTYKLTVYTSVFEKIALFHFPWKCCLVLTVASRKKTRFCFPWEAVLFLIIFGAAKQIAILMLCKLPSAIHTVVYCFITDIEGHSY